ncbi:Aspartic proteinase MKC7 [Yarrowia sp. B02]|nr:Aspartic proteinase MKC7 [Yarrowia sp. B02]
MIFSNILLASVAAAGVVHLPLTVRNTADHPEIQEAFSKRYDHAELIAGKPWYDATVELGTPPQKVSLAVDTGSGHLWVPGTNSTACEKHQCHTGGSFEIANSSSWRFREMGANWGGHGLNGRETLSFAGQTLKDFVLYVTTDHMSNNYGWFGHSPDKNGSLSFVQGLADAKKISRAVYSLSAEAPVTEWNRDHPANEQKHIVTNLYYGGFDRAKYEGPLVTIDRASYGGYAMNMSGFTVDNEPVKLPRDYQVVLDTGGITITLPNATVAAVAKKHGGAYNAEHKLWTIDCDAKPVIEYGFGYTSIPVDMDQFVKPLKGVDHTCAIQGLTVSKDSDGTLLSGPHVISRALVIFDNDRKQTHIARAKYTDETDVVEIDGDIPGTVKYSDWLAGKPLPGDAATHTTLAVAH